MIITGTLIRYSGKKHMKRKEFVKAGLTLLASGSLIFVACSEDEVNPTTTDDDSDANADVSSCEAATGIDKIICLADAFKSQLTSSQLATLQLTYSKADAIKWSNFPQALMQSNVKRVGLNFGSMTSVQISYAKALIKELSGSEIENEGWNEIEQILNADDYLKTVNANGGYGSENYYISFLGTPAASGTFAILFGGHHLAFQNTYIDGQLAGVTPSFRGIEPKGNFTYNGVSNQPLEQENAALLAIVNSLSSSELSTAKLSPAVSDLVAGPQKDDNIPSTYSGLKCSALTSAQRNLVLAAIRSYVVDVAAYETFLNTYENELEETYVAYSGNTTLSARGDYFRIHGPSVWIEWAVQPPVALADPHIHSVWRDRLKDYGGN